MFVRFSDRKSRAESKVFKRVIQTWASRRRFGFYNCHYFCFLPLNQNAKRKKESKSTFNFVFCRINKIRNLTHLKFLTNLKLKKNILD